MTNTHAQATFFMTLVVRSIQKTPAIVEALLKSLSRSSGFRLCGIEKIGGILTNFLVLQTYPKNEPRSSRRHKVSLSFVSWCLCGPNPSHTFVFDLA